MARYHGYIIESDMNKNKMISHLEALEFPIPVDEEVREILKDKKYTISCNNLWEWTVNCLTDKDYPYLSFCFAQMDGNCNGMMINSILPRGQVAEPSIKLKVATAIAVNIASYLGNNMLITSHYDKYDEIFENHGWTKIVSAKSNRGYPNNISYWFIELKLKQMITKNFTFKSNANNFTFVKKQDKIEEAAVI